MIRVINSRPAITINKFCLICVIVQVMKNFKIASKAKRIVICTTPEIVISKVSLLGVIILVVPPCLSTTCTFIYHHVKITETYLWESCCEVYLREDGRNKEQKKEKFFHL